MGGLEDGARVSRAAIAAVRDSSTQVARLARQAARSSSGSDRRALFGGVESLYDEAGQQLYELAEDEGQRMGTTLTTAILSGNQLTIGHVGDTRAYRVRNGQVDLLTTDHSVAALRYRRGTMSLEEYYTSPLRNVLYEYLGHDPEVGTDVVETDLLKGDRLVLCTDGVWDYLGNDRIVALASIDAPQAAAEAFVDEALALGSDDNCTAVVVQILGVATTRHLFPAAALGQSKLFDGMHRNDLRLIAPYMSIRSLYPGDCIIQEGELGDELFLVASGKVEVRRKGIPLVQLGPKVHFGELALVCDTPRSASVYAVEPTDLIVLDREALNTLGEKRPDLANRVLNRLLDWIGHRLIEMTDRAVKAENDVAKSKG